MCKASARTHAHAYNTKRTHVYFIASFSYYIRQDIKIEFMTLYLYVVSYKEENILKKKGIFKLKSIRSL